MRQLATLATLLGLLNGVWALVLNVRRSRHPELETRRGARVRQVVTWAFVAVLAVLVVLLAVVAVVSLVQISE